METKGNTMYHQKYQNGKSPIEGIRHRRQTRKRGSKWEGHQKLYIVSNIELSPEINGHTDAITWRNQKPESKPQQLIKAAQPAEKRKKESLPGKRTGAGQTEEKRGKNQKTNSAKQQGGQEVQGHKPKSAKLTQTKPGARRQQIKESPDAQKAHGEQQEKQVNKTETKAIGGQPEQRYEKTKKN